MANAPDIVIVGAGKGLVHACYRIATALGVQMTYDDPFTHPEPDDDKVFRVNYKHEGKSHRAQPKSVIAPSRGIPAGADWLTRTWGGAP